MSRRRKKNAHLSGDGTSFESLMGVSLRAAVEDDEPEIYDLLKMMHAEIAMAPLNEQKLAKWISYLNELPPAGPLKSLIIVAECKKTIVGSVGLIRDTWWYGDDDFVRDMWTYVHPRYRRSRIIDELIEAAKLAAKEEFRAPLAMGVLSRDDAEAKTRLFARHLKPVGGIFVDGM